MHDTLPAFSSSLPRYPSKIPAAKKTEEIRFMRSILLVQVSRCEAFCLQHIRWWVVDSLVSTADPVPVIYVTYEVSIGQVMKNHGLQIEM
jgi:hypothetical protein